MSVVEFGFPWQAYYSHLTLIDDIRLTNKEIDIIACVMSGKSSKAIAPILSVTSKTIDTHIQNIKRKFDVNDRNGITKRIEKSSQFHIFNGHYAALLNKHFFEQALKVLYQYQKNENNEYVFAYWEINKSQQTVVDQIIKHLNLSGIKTVITELQEFSESCILLKKEEYMNCIAVFAIVPNAAIQIMNNNIDEKDQLQTKILDNINRQHPEIVFLNLNDERQLQEPILQVMKSYNFLDYHETQNYYFFLKDILEKILSSEKFDQFMAKFNENSANFTQKKVIAKSYISPIDNTPKKLSLIDDVIKGKKNLWIVFFITYSFMIFLIYYAMPSDHKVSHTIGNLPYPNKHFIGRQNLLNQINNCFMMMHEHIVAITGGPGMGKTQLAKKYTFNYSKNYDLSWWFDARQDLYNQYRQLSMSLNSLLPQEARIDPINFSKESLVNKVKHLIISHNLKVLFIFDNASSFDDIKEFIPYSPNKVINVLITSRNQDIWSKAIKIDKFDRPESVRLIQNYLPKVTSVEAENFAKTMDDYPLELAVAISSVKNFPQISINDYVVNYLKSSTPCQKKDVNMTNNSPNLDGYNSDICKSVQISLDYLAKQYPKSLELLYVMSLLNSKDIPHCYIEQWIASNYKDANALDVIKPLIDQSLVDINTATKMANSKYTYSMHDLVHKVVRDLISVKDKSRIIDQAAQIMLDVIPRRSDLLVEKLISEPIHLQHAERLLKEAQRIDYMSKNLSMLMAKIFCFYVDGARDFERAKQVLDDIKESSKNNKIRFEPYDQALFLTTKGYFISIYHADYQTSTKYMLEALSLLSTFDSTYEEKLLIILHIAEYSVLRGMNDQSETWLSRGKNLFENSKSNVYNIYYLYTHALLNINKANYNIAYKFVENAKKYIPLISHYPIFKFGVLDREIELFLRMKKFDDAKICNDALYKKLKDFFQDRENSYLARNLLYRSWITLKTKQDYDQAIQDIDKSIEMANRLFHGSDMHIMQGLQHMILGWALEGQHKYDQALAEYQFAERIYKKILEQLNDMDDVSVLYQHLMQISLKLNRLEQAKQYLKTHIKLFGPNHPRTKAMQVFITRR